MAAAEWVEAVLAMATEACYRSAYSFQKECYTLLN